MDIDNLTIGEAKRLAALFSAPTAPNDSPYIVGRTYLFRSVTYTVTGVVVCVTSLEIVLTDAAWIADTGRFAAALDTSNFAEVEAPKNGAAILGRTAITDAWTIENAPRTTK